MAQGRRDYTSGILSETGTGARYTECYFHYEGHLVGSMYSHLLWDYTCPAGKRLGINSIHVSTSSRALETMEIDYKGNNAAKVHFSENHVFTFSDQNPLYVVAGENIQIRVFNYDEINAYFYLCIIGVLESL